MKRGGYNTGSLHDNLDESEIGKSFTEEGLTTIRIKGDGNCLFRAIAEIARSDTSIANIDYIELRRRVIQELRSNEFLKAILIRTIASELHREENAIDEREVENYIHRMNLSGTFASEPELLACSKILNTKLVVYLENESGVLTSTPYDYRTAFSSGEDHTAELPTIKLIFEKFRETSEERNHYNLLVDSGLAFTFARARASSTKMTVLQRELGEAEIKRMNEEPSTRTDISNVALETGETREADVVHDDMEIISNYEHYVGKYNYYMQAELLILLGDVTLSKVVGQDDTHLKYHLFAKASAFYNAALIRVKEHNKRNIEIIDHDPLMEEKITGKIFDLENQCFQVFEIEYDINIESWKKSGEEYKQRLCEIREDVAKKVQHSGFNISLQSHLDREVSRGKGARQSKSINVTRAREVEQATTIKEIYNHSTEEMLKLFVSIINDYSIAILGEQPCKFAIIAFGSMARGEMTPYSDLEWGIIIDTVKVNGSEITEQDRDYFRKLSQLAHFKIINLGETSLGTVGEKYFEELYKRHSNDYDELACGFSFDGQFERACRSPLGNMHTNKDSAKKFELIGTVDELMRFQSDEWRDIDNKLVVEAANTCFIYGDEELFNRYTTRLNEPNFVELRRKIGFDLVSLNLQEFSVELGGVFEGKNYNVKREIYRFPDRMIENLTLICGLGGLGAFSKLDLLEQKGVLSSQAVENLKVVIAISMETRLRVYVLYKQRKESITIIPPYEIESSEGKESNNKVCYLKNKHILERFYFTIIPFEEALKDFIVAERFNTDDQTVPTVIKNELFDDSTWNRSRIQARMLRYKEAIKLLEPSFDSELLDFTNSRPRDGWKLYDLSVRLTTFFNWCLIIGNYKKGKEIFDRFRYIEESGITFIIPKQGTKNIAANLQKIQHVNTHNIAAQLNNYACLYLVTREYKKARKLFQRSRETYKSLYSFGSVEEVDVINHIAQTYLQQDNDNPHLELRMNAQKYILEAVKIIELLKQLNERKEEVRFLKVKLLFIKGIYERFECNYGESLLELKNAIKIALDFYVDNHYFSMKIYQELATTLVQTAEYKKAEDIYRKLIKELPNIYKTNDHPDIGLVLNNLGELYILQGQYDQAIEVLTRSREIYIRTFGEDDRINFLLPTKNLIRVYLLKGHPFIISEMISPAIKDQLGLLNTSSSAYIEAINFYDSLFPEERIALLSDFHIDLSMFSDILLLRMSMFQIATISAYKNKLLEEAKAHCEIALKLCENEFFKEKILVIDRMLRVECTLLERYKANPEDCVRRVLKFSSLTRGDVKQYFNEILQEAVGFSSDCDGNDVVLISARIKGKLELKIRREEYLIRKDEGMNSQTQNLTNALKRKHSAIEGSNEIETEESKGTDELDNADEMSEDNCVIAEEESEEDLEAAIALSLQLSQQDQKPIQQTVVVQHETATSSEELSIKVQSLWRGYVVRRNIDKDAKSRT